ncbi:SDR family NAD(P)-dependent oxidoreductase [Actinoplanes sp. GCM10030250]|uniref:SDR family NAD(P)-dependent oxidoreductase n=1 Tax=Actinoplanes sp. GCM10030250 TaxID=3273376 RepID=UPI0036062ACF
MNPRVVVITGASSGIGRAAALAFAARGDQLVLGSRRMADLEKVAVECGGNPLVVPVDVTSSQQVAQLAAVATSAFGRIDVWVNTAAVMAYGKFEDVPPEVFDRVVVTGLIGPANVARTALSRFRAQGHGTLIVCESLLARIAVPQMSSYIASKWGLRGLIRSLRQENRDLRDVHICAVSPGSVDTPIFTSAANYAGFVGRPPPPVDRPERVARQIIRLADRPRADVSVGAANWFIRAGFVALPRLYDVLVTPMVRGLVLSRERSEDNEGNVFTPAPRVEGGPARWGRGQTGLAAVALLATGSALAAGLGSLRRR